MKYIKSFDFVHSDGIIRGIIGLTINNNSLLTLFDVSLFFALFDSEFNQVIDHIERGDLVTSHSSDKSQLAH